MFSTLLFYFYLSVVQWIVNLLNTAIFDGSLDRVIQLLLFARFKIDTVNHFSQRDYDYSHTPNG